MNSRCLFVLLALVLVGAGLSALGVSVTLRIETVVNGDLIELTENAITIRDSARGDVVIFSNRIANSFTIEGEDTVFIFPVSRDSLPEAALEYWDAPAAQQHSTWNLETPKLYGGIFANLMLGTQSSKGISYEYGNELKTSSSSSEFSFGGFLGYRDVLQLAFSYGCRATSLEHPQYELDNDRLRLSTSRLELRAAPWCIGSRKPRKLRVFLLAGIGHSPDLFDEIDGHFENGNMSVFGVAFSWLRYNRTGKAIYEISGSLEYETIAFDRFSRDGYGSMKHDAKLNTFRFNIRFGGGCPILTDAPRATDSQKN